MRLSGDGGSPPLVTYRGLTGRNKNSWVRSRKSLSTNSLAVLYCPRALKYRLANFVMSYLIQTDRKTRLMDDIFHGYTYRWEEQVPPPNNFATRKPLQISLF
ncbi:hypothetical protein Zmor_010653 [Zophobas morio]|uniref:Uncharacterized protein n=1 Tax=Zophobas morio TaxID=2755281 RepID=A0AA38MJV7_9CUCU|nr:hypothetical protein Zmor_010653 [Zophobas morio]